MNSALRNFEGSAQELSSWPIRAQQRIAVSSAASSYNPMVERRRAALIAAIKHLVASPITWTEDEPTPIDGVSAETALAFIHKLPPDRAFPKIAPDGEGGIMLVWDQVTKALITIDRGILLLVTNPGQPNSHHFRPLRFDGEMIPSIILESLPRANSDPT
jgi:hypothetical protein